MYVFSPNYCLHYLKWRTHIGRMVNPGGWTLPMCLASFCLSNAEKSAIISLRSSDWKKPFSPYQSFWTISCLKNSLRFLIFGFWPKVSLKSLISLVALADLILVISCISAGVFVLWMRNTKIFSNLEYSLHGYFYMKKSFVFFLTVLATQ